MVLVLEVDTDEMDHEGFEILGMKLVASSLWSQEDLVLAELHNDLEVTGWR